jgi:uncharacterized membrane protein YfcA
VVISGGDAALLLGAGALAGVVGTGGGITSLVSYPALLLIGVPALSANATNIVALVSCWPGSALASRPELAGKGSWLKRWIPVTALGGALGAVLLLSTPKGVFGPVVPFLLVAAAVALLGQPRLSAWHRRHFAPGAKVLLPAGLLVLSLYNGYFGAGAGVMTLALVLFATEPHLATANALKNMLIGSATVISAATLALLAPVDWSAALPLSAGMLAGSVIGPRLARRVPATVLRWSVALLGLGVAVAMWS